MLYQIVCYTGKERRIVKETSKRQFAEVTVENLNMFFANPDKPVYYTLEKKNEPLERDLSRK